MRLAEISTEPKSCMGMKIEYDMPFVIGDQLITSPFDG